MCGIFCQVTCKRPAENIIGSGSSCESLDCFADLLKSRGPDFFSEHVSVREDCEIQFAASVLWMQGQSASVQPVADSEGKVLLWNGDNYKNALTRTSSDTMELFEALSTHASPLEILSKVRGPFAFVYFTGSRLYFGRDCLGRHSLLWAIDENKKKLILTSVVRRGLLHFSEVPAAGVFNMKMDPEGLNEIMLHPWSNISEDSMETIQRNSEINFKISSVTVPSPIPPGALLLHELPLWSSVLDTDTVIECGSDNHNVLMVNLLSQPEINKNILQLTAALCKAVQVRVKTQPGSCRKCLCTNVPCEENSKVCSVPKEDSKMPVNDFREEVHESDCESSSMSDISSSFSTSLNIHNSDGMNKNNNTHCDHATVGILFSGGLDSAVLAALAHEFVPAGQPIELLNVAFERTAGGQQNMCRKERRKAIHKSEQEGSEFQVPDRITGIKTLEELRSMFPERQWNFVEINVTRAELENERKHIISDLIYPLSTVLDDSLGCAVWFAARGKGQLKASGEYQSTARVLLLGMGADELLGGYARHRTAFRHQGWSGLHKELAMDLARISQRNLGRDDRVLSHHARQGRFPFLDEEVVSLITSLQPWERCWPSNALPVGVGDKLLLRLVAWNLGLRQAATLPKRAFQFGSRIANPKEKASDRSLRLEDAT